MIKRRNNQKGLTLLEYCVGAALIGLIVFAVLHVMGGRLQNSTRTTGEWVEDKADQLKQEASEPVANVGD